MIGALALVGVLVAVVILKGLAPREDGLEENAGGEWSGGTPALMLGPDGQPLVQVPETMTNAGEEPIVVDLSAPLLPDEDLALQPDPLANVGADLGAATVPGTVTPVTEPAAPLTAPVSDKLSYVVKKGDTLGHIAQRELGSVKYTPDILRLNPDLNPNNLKLGQEIKLPARSELAPVSTSSPAPAAAGETMHVVAAGDTLWGLAERYLGNGSRSGEIVAANPDKLKSRDAMLVIGMKLRMPKR